MVPQKPQNLVETQMTVPVCACWSTDLFKLKLHVKIDTQAILISVGKFLRSLSYLYSIILRKVDIFPACYHAGYIHSSLYLLMADQEEMRRPSRVWPPKSIQSILYSEMPSGMRSNFSFSKGTSKLVKWRDYGLGSIV